VSIKVYEFQKSVINPYTDTIETVTDYKAFSNGIRVGFVRIIVGGEYPNTTKSIEVKQGNEIVVTQILKEVY